MLEPFSAGAPEDSVYRKNLVAEFDVSQASSAAMPHRPQAFRKGKIMTAEQLGNILVGVNIIDSEAIDDPENYENGLTLRHLESALSEIEAAFKSEVQVLKGHITKLEKVAEFDAWRIKRPTGEAKPVGKRDGCLRHLVPDCPICHDDLAKGGGA